MKPTQLVWLRNDLRLDDNPALFHACQQGPVHVVFCATPAQWQTHHESAARLGLKAATLADLAKQFGVLGIPFTLLEANHFIDVANTLRSFCEQEAISDLWFNQETPLDERRRDEQVVKTLSETAVHCHALDYDLMVPSPVLTKQQQPFKVFTPFYRQWLQLLQETARLPYPAPPSQGNVVKNQFIPPSWAGDFRQDLWLSHEQDVLTQLDKFCEQKIIHYVHNRDFPNKPATSTLSPYLTNGQIGPRRLLAVIQFHCMQHGRHWQDNDWLRELAWRDFYRQLMLHFPRLNMSKAFKSETEQLQWRQDNDQFQAWCEGRTGFPIIDAAMRQLQQTAWMHNRLRMLSASFFSKLLFMDWRQGERFFMQSLIDGEFCANNGGWQWSASTGCDAAPYFRIFNPTRQSERFDPEGDFIRRFVPELASVDKKQIHNPPEELRKRLDYPSAIVDYKTARLAAIEAFKHL